MTLILIAELADELCDPHHHVERVPYWDHNRHRRFREHRTVQPGLLTQLAALIGEMTTSVDGTTTRPIMASRPPANVDALSCHTVITMAAARWCWSLKLDLRDTPEGNIRALVGAVTLLDEDTTRTLADEMRDWRNTASVLTGWSTPPYRPQVPCPVPDCAQVGKLRINLSRHTGICLACRATWDIDTIGILADYVRGVTEGTAA